MAEETDSETAPQVNTANEFFLGFTRAHYNTFDKDHGVIRPSGLLPVFCTRQQAYRFAAWLVCMAELLPEEELPSTFEEVLAAIQSS